MPRDGKEIDEDGYKLEKGMRRNCPVCGAAEPCRANHFLNYQPTPVNHSEEK